MYVSWSAPGLPANVQDRKAQTLPRDPLTVKFPDPSPGPYLSQSLVPAFPNDSHGQSR